MKTQKVSYVYAMAAVFFWSTVATVFKLGLRYVSPAELLFWATTGSVIALLFIIIINGKLKLLLAQSHTSLLSSALLGLLNPFLYYLILFGAYKRLPGQVAQPLNMIWPIVLVFLAAPFLKQKIRIRNILALLVSFLGVVWIASQGSFFHPEKSDTLGIILATGSSVIWSFFWIANIRDPRQEEIKLLTNFLFALIYIFIYMLILNRMKIPPWQGFAAGIYTGFFEMGFTFFFWLKALRHATTTASVSNLVFLAPFLSLVFLHYFAGEKIYITTLAGLLLILTGIFIQNVSFISKKKNNA
ncbi:MAG: DMT family transporter [Chlorobi bacterium]|nr:DMT family transporter [Chlorobiota bacterium]